MCSPASFETAYVQRVSPTEPIVETWPSATLYACVPKISLVEISTSRSIEPRVAVQVVEQHDLVGLDQASRERRADEPRPAGQEDALPGKRHGGESSGEAAAISIVRRYGGDGALRRRGPAPAARDPAGSRAGAAGGRGRPQSERTRARRGQRR